MNDGKNPILKTPRYKDKKGLQAAKGQACVRCKRENGTTVSAHYTGEGQIDLGKGVGGKLSDLFTAWLCYDCHVYFDQYQGIESKADKEKRSSEFMICIFETLKQKFDQGIYKINSAYYKVLTMLSRKSTFLDKKQALKDIQNIFNKEV